MKPRRKLLFKINNEVITEESEDLFFNQIDEIKWILAQEFECSFDEVEVEVLEYPIEFSEDIDVAEEGLIFWKSLHHKPVIGVFCEYDEGSNEYLDAMINGTLEENLHFFI
jgi:hypothetical protein